MSAKARYRIRNWQDYNKSLVQTGLHTFGTKVADYQ